MHPKDFTPKKIILFAASLSAFTLTPLQSYGASWTAIADSPLPGKLLLAEEGKTKPSKEDDGLQLPEGRLYEITASQARQIASQSTKPKSLRPLLRFEGERILAILPALFHGKKGTLLVREWRVEGALPYRLAFVPAEIGKLKNPKATEIELKDLPQCDTLQKITLNSEKIEWSCVQIETSLDGSGKTYTKNSVFISPALALKPLSQSAISVTLPQATTATLELKQKSSTDPDRIPVPGEFDSIQLRSK